MKASQQDGIPEDVVKAGKVQRILRIITALQSVQKYSAMDLAELLGVSRRTIFRDLKDLEKVGVPCHYNPGEHYYEIDKDFFLASPDLNTMETLGLLLLVHKARDHIRLPFRESALYAALKIESNLDEKVKKFCSSALEKITIKNGPHIKTNSLNKLFLHLIEAILKKRIVKISYNLSHGQPNESFHLRPCHLLYNGNLWNVLGTIDNYNSIRVLKLNRIKELHVLNKCFVENEKFDIHEFFGRAWSMLPEGRLYHVKLKFSPQVADDVAEIQWHCTQTASWQQDGSVIIDFRVDGLGEIKWWVLSYGDQVQVLAPKILQRRIVETARNIAKINSREIKPPRKVGAAKQYLAG
jgi:proteasome accessory factor B